jgi:hypothetical protein
MPGNTTIEIRLISLAVDLFGTVNVSEQPLKTSSKSCLGVFLKSRFWSGMDDQRHKQIPLRKSINC